MGYSYYTLPDGREAGYGVEAECDHPECTTKIDRGLFYLCGRQPDGHRDPEEPGCGRYYCSEHEHDHDCPNPDPADSEMPWLDLLSEPESDETTIPGTPGTPKLPQEHTDV